MANNQKKYKFIPPTKFAVFPALTYRTCPYGHGHLRFGRLHCEECGAEGEVHETEIAKNLHEYTGYLEEVEE